MRTFLRLLTLLMLVGAGSLLLLSGPALANGATPVTDPQPANVAAVPASGPVNPPNPPCEPGTDDRTSDLCAQWKAADSASSSALWAERSFWLTVLGTIALMVTLLFNAKSTAAAARASKAAEDSLSHSREMAQKELRAYIDLSNPELVKFGEKINEDEFEFRFKIYLKNFGHTQAIHLRYRDEVIFGDVRPANDPITETDWEGDGNLAQNDDVHFETFVIFNKEVTDDISSGDVILHYVLEFEYRDIFDKRHGRRLLMAASLLSGITILSEMDLDQPILSN